MSQERRSEEHMVKAEPPRPETPEYAKKYWENLDNLFNRTVGYAEDAFKTNKNINLVVVGVGIVFVGYAIANSALRGLDLFSTAFGSLGIVAFIATFYFTPQKKIQKTVGDLTQIQMFYRTYWSQVENVLDWIREHHAQMTLDDVDKANSQLENITKYAVGQIEEYIGKE